MLTSVLCVFFFFSSRRRHTRCGRDWSSDVCSSDLEKLIIREEGSGSREILERGLADRNRSLTSFREIVEMGNANIMKKMTRSEERRVGKECRYRWSTEH